LVVRNEDPTLHAFRPPKEGGKLKKTESNIGDRDEVPEI
jgi:hypothetical protein